jgi:S1 RNA binding domain protein
MSPDQMTIELGSTVKGTVVKIADYGAIVRLGGGKTGLVHISEIADAFVRDVRDYLCEDDEVTVKVLRLNNKGRYELSMKQCEAQLPPRSERREPVHAASHPVAREQFEQHSPPEPRPLATFEDRLSRFLKDSEQRQHDLKRNTESKRGRR